MKDSYILEFTGLPELTKYLETDLETKIIDHLQAFLLELGRGVTFVGRQVRFTFEDEHYRVVWCFLIVYYVATVKLYHLIELQIFHRRNNICIHMDHLAIGLLNFEDDPAGMAPRTGLIHKFTILH